MKAISGFEYFKYNLYLLSGLFLISVALIILKLNGTAHEYAWLDEHPDVRAIVTNSRDRCYDEKTILLTLT